MVSQQSLHKFSTHVSPHSNSCLFLSLLLGLLLPPLSNSPEDLLSVLVQFQLGDDDL